LPTDKNVASVLKTGKGKGKGVTVLNLLMSLGFNIQILYRKVGGS